MSALRPVIGAFLSLLILLVLLQRKLIYFPERTDEESLLILADRLRLAPWRNDDGEIIGWRAFRSDIRAANRLLVFHGNAGNAVMRNHYHAGLGGIDGGRLWDVVVFEYPGYGARRGTPSEENILAAAEQAMRQLQREDNRPVYICGKSLGSGPACYLAGKFPRVVSGLLLIAPFTSLPDVAAYHYPFLPVRLIMKDRFDNVAALAGYEGPLAVVLAGRDQIVPARLGRRLYEGYRGPKIIETLADLDHNEFDFSPGEGWLRSVSEFLVSRP